CHLPMPDPQHSCVFLECSPGAKGTLIAALYPVLKHQIPFSVAEISQPKPLQAVKNGALNSDRGVQMKKFLLGSVAAAALGIGVPAIAADMAVRPVAAALAFSWTGCHLGGLVGFGWGRDPGYSTAAGSTFVTTPPAFPQNVPLVAGQQLTDSFNTSGFVGGGGAGCDYQFGSIVVGVDGDWNNTNKEGQSFIISHTNPLFLRTAAGGTLGF